MFQWTKSNDRLNRYAGLLKGPAMTYLIHYWGVIHELAANAVHKHSFYEICYVNGGSGVYEEEGRSFPLYEGVVINSRPEVLHQISEVDGLDLLFVAFEPDKNQSEAEAYESYTKSLLQGAVWTDSAGQSPT
ncbi:AraC family ligand binding domain-containing protein, partial [Paenibacillus sepulcri]|nr:AraC family ligand binding domain-containing protein [Paenibacillus sepulcri]